MNCKNIFKSVLMMFLLSYGVSVCPMMSPAEQKQMLFEMCAQGDIAGVSRLIDSGVDINLRDSYGWTPLHRACQRGDKDFVHYLVEHGADVYASSGQGLSPAQIALGNGYTDIADYIIASLKPNSEKTAQINRLKLNTIGNAKKLLVVEQSNRAVGTSQSQLQIDNVPSGSAGKKVRKKKIKLEYVQKYPAPMQETISVQLPKVQQYVAQVQPNENLDTKQLYQPVQNQHNALNVLRDVAAEKSTQSQQSVGQIKSKKATRKGQKKNKPKSSVQAVQQAPIIKQNSGVAQVQKKQQLAIEVTRTDNAIHIYNYSKKPDCYTEVILFKECKNCLPHGIYYRTANGLVRVNGTLMSNGGVPMCNPLLNLTYTDHVKSKMHQDMRHAFSTAVDMESGGWARVVIKNSITEPYKITESTKFDLIITIPGQINEVDYSSGESIITNRLSGVFEFVVKKNIYEPKGMCTHRFFAPKGVVGAENFGAYA